MRGVDFDLLAKATDQIIDRAIKDIGLTPADQIEQAVAAHHLTRMAHQRMEQMIFARRQRDFGACIVDEHALDLAQHPRTEGIARPTVIQRAPVRLRSAQDGADTCDQLARVKGFDDIIVGANLQSDDPRHRHAAAIRIGLLPLSAHKQSIIDRLRNEQRDRYGQHQLADEAAREKPRCHAALPSRLTSQASV